MKNRRGSLFAGSLLLAGALALAPSGVSAQTALTFSGNSANIPDGSLSGPGASVTSTITIAEPGPLDITKITVEPGINHSWIGDLEVKLSFNGTDVMLMDRVGQDFMWNGDAPYETYGSGHMNVRGGFESGGAGTDLETKAAPTGNGVTVATGPHAPSMGNLDSFVGMDANGTWTLTVTDHALYDVGQINFFKITIECDCPPDIELANPSPMPGVVVP